MSNILNGKEIDLLALAKSSLELREHGLDAPQNLVALLIDGVADSAAVDDAGDDDAEAAMLACRLIDAYNLLIVRRCGHEAHRHHRQGRGPRSPRAPAIVESRDPVVHRCACGLAA